MSPQDNEQKLMKLLEESSTLKCHHTKKWLKKKIQFDKFKEPGAKSQAKKGGVPMIKKQYLMSEQEIKQNEIIEAIFKKFD